MTSVGSIWNKKTALHIYYTYIRRGLPQARGVSVPQRTSAQTVSYNFSTPQTLKGNDAKVSKQLSMSGFTDFSHITK